MIELSPEMHTFWNRLAMTLLHFLWQGTAIYICLWMFLKLFPFNKPQSRYTIYLTSMLLMALCPAITFYTIHSPVPVEVTANVVQPTSHHVEVSEDTESTKSQPARIEVKNQALSSTQIPVVISEPAKTFEEKKIAAVPIVAQPRSWTEVLSSLTPLFLLFWIVGVLFFSLRLLIGWRAMFRWKRNATGHPRLEKMITQLSQTLRIKTMPLVLLCSEATEAMAVGFLKPMVLIPTSWALEMSPNMLEAVIAHELAHIQRWDLWINLLQRLVEALLFYHPAIWVISNQIRIEREHCCDDLAVAMTGSRDDYAQTLQFVASLKLAGTPALATAIGGRKMKLFDRVKHVLGQNEKEPRTSWGIAGLVALAVPALLWVCSFSLMPLAADDDDAPKEGRKKVVREDDHAKVKHDRDRPPHKDHEHSSHEDRKQGNQNNDRHSRRHGDPSHHESDRDRGPREHHKRGDRGPRDDGRPNPRDNFKRGPRGERDGEDRPPRREGDERRDGDRGRRPERRDDFRQGNDDLMEMIRDLHREIRRLRREVEELRDDLDEVAEELGGDDDDDDDVERERPRRPEGRSEGRPPRKRDFGREDRPRPPRERGERPPREREEPKPNVEAEE